MGEDQVGAGHEQGDKGGEEGDGDGATGGEHFVAGVDGGVEAGT